MMVKSNCKPKREDCLVFDSSRPEDFRFHIANVPKGAGHQLFITNWPLEVEIQIYKAVNKTWQKHAVISSYSGSCIILPGPGCYGIDFRALAPDMAALEPPVVITCETCLITKDIVNHTNVGRGETACQLSVEDVQVLAQGVMASGDVSTGPAGDFLTSFNQLLVDAANGDAASQAALDALCDALPVKIEEVLGGGGTGGGGTSGGGATFLAMFNQLVADAQGGDADAQAAIEALCDVMPVKIEEVLGGGGTGGGGTSGSTFLDLFNQLLTDAANGDADSQAAIDALCEAIETKIEEV